MKNFRRFIIFLTVFAVLTRDALFSVNASSRMATIESLVDNHSLVIDNSRFIFTIDKYFYQGHFYSDKPPLLAIYSSVFYWVMNNVFNISFENHPHLTYYVLTILVVGISSCVALNYFSKLLDSFQIDSKWSNIVLLVTGFGTLILPYSTIFNNHVVSGSLLLFSVYNLFKIEEGVKYVISSGFFISLAGSIDITCFVFLPFAFIVLFKSSLQTKMLFTLSCAPVILIYFWLNHYTSGSLIPPAMNKSLWNYPGSVFNEQSLSGLAQSSNISQLLIYSFNMLLGTKGLLSYTPILLFSIFALVKNIFFERGFKYKKEYLFIATASLAFVMLYVLRSNNYSGYSYGVRWFASLMFIICIPLAHLAEDLRRFKLLRKIFVVVAYISIFISFIGVVSPFTPNTDDGSSSFIECMYILKNSSISYIVSLFTCMFLVFYILYKLLKEARLNSQVTKFKTE